jgi:hypothetical protein
MSILETTTKAPLSAAFSFVWVLQVGAVCTSPGCNCPALAQWTPLSVSTARSGSPRR